MQLISIQFVLFLALTAVILRSTAHWRNYLLLLSSYVFYCTWDRSMALLLLAATIMSYFAALLLHKTRTRVIASVAILGTVFLLISTLAWFKLRSELHLGTNPV